MNIEQRSKFVKLFNYVVFCIGVVVSFYAISERSLLLGFLGLVNLLSSVCTLNHIATGRHNSFSKLPEDYKVDSTVKEKT